MALTPWKKLREEVIHANPYWKYCKATFVAARGEHDYYFCDTRGAVLMVAVDADGKIPLVRQFRPLVQKEVVEFPMGGIGDDTPQAGAEREFAEEAKLRANHVEFVGDFSACIGIITEICHVFFGTELEPAAAEQDPQEEFERFRATPEEIEAMIQSGEFGHGMCIAAWHMAKPRVLEVIDQLKGKR